MNSSVQDLVLHFISFAKTEKMSLHVFLMLKKCIRTIFNKKCCLEKEIEFAIHTIKEEQYCRRMDLNSKNNLVVGHDMNK